MGWMDGWMFQGWSWVGEKKGRGKKKGGGGRRAAGDVLADRQAGKEADQGGSCCSFVGRAHETAALVWDGMLARCMWASNQGHEGISLPEGEGRSP